MFDGWAILALGIAYIGVLFAIAWTGDRAVRSRKGGEGRPLIYALSLGVYCTSWTFFGSVGLAASTGYNFIPVYIGPILMFVFGWPLILRIVRLSKSQNITSVADFLAARYGKSQAVAAVVTIVAVVGTLPYIALQLKAVVISTEALLVGNLHLPEEWTAVVGFGESALLAAIALATFAVLFGTRHIDATEHQDGLMLAVAAESLVKLAAFLTVGIFVLVSVFDGIDGFAERARQSAEIQATFARPFNGGIWLTVSFLSFVCIILLPRQFHVTVVENNSEREIKRARWLFPVYLVLINVFVVPIAAAGLLVFPDRSIDADLFVLSLPISRNANLITTVAYIGGLSAATAMVIVESIALAIMVCNGLVIPLLLRQRLLEASEQDNLSSLLLIIRRVAIFLIVLLGYLVYRALGQAQGLAAIGLISFSAIAQLAPAFFGGLIWRKGTARGAIAGILAGFSVWGYTLLLPWVVKAGWIGPAILEHGPLGFAMLRPQALFFLEFEPLAHGVIWSIFANILALVMVSLLRPPEPVERLQAHVFVQDDLPRLAPTPTFRLWRTSITVSDLQATVARYLGAERAERSFAEFGAGRNTTLSPHAEADIQILRFTEHLLTSAIGAASSRLVLSLLLRRSNVGSQSALRLLDDASEALQYNRDLLQSALDQVRHGLSVFDKDLKLICWNRQFRELLDLPAELGQVGMPLNRILRACAERGDFGKGPLDELVADRLVRLAVRKETVQEKMSSGRFLEIRTAAMPQGGVVATYSDITDRVAAANALARANETLERRVRERTAELLRVNAQLAVAKAKADEANFDKTRFLAAASHDLLQPLNAARLYSSSLVERHLSETDAVVARNVDASLSAVEEILGALIDISRMDAGRLAPEITDVPLDALLSHLKLEFEPLAREKGLELRVMSTSLWVRTDRTLLRRVLQNLVANAVKYTERGSVLLGARRRNGAVRVQVSDTGRGIPPSKHEVIFKEFQRLDDHSSEIRGLGLGLSIVERICRVLEVPISLSSRPGQGSTFAVLLPRAEPNARAAGPVLRVQAQGPIAGCVTLCIDNEPAVLEGMETLLAGWGCKVLTASSAAGALEVVGRFKAVPDIILADYHLDGETGLQAVLKVREVVGGDLPAVFITADHSPEVERELRSRGFALLRKPLKAAALRAVITRLAMRRVAAE
ncbi:MAG: PAS-domain containing protein [Hyphomicrobiaceae bacterium]|nr:PAS-domain containing protein [Hyphomicrobiaceae bacterium]